MEYPFALRWSGSTAGDYSRAAVAHAPGKIEIPVSAAVEYAGDVERWNPEDLFGASLGLCHMLTFLALARKVRIDVRSYEEAGAVFLGVVDGFTKVTRVRLAPTIALASDASPEKARELFEKAHKHCFIGNSITSEVVMEPTFVVAP